MQLSDFFDLKHTSVSTYLKKYTYPWEAIEGIGEMILSLDKTDYIEIFSGVWIHKSAKIASSAYIGAPSIIGGNTDVRHCAFIRGNALIGENCVIGNSTELKNVILFDGVQVPHFNYVGDSILGFKAHMGAGSITSNVKSDKSEITVHSAERDFYTGLKKFGAILGDFAEVGCNSVLNPGTVIGKNTTVYPLSSVRGVIPSDSIYKKGGIIAAKR